MEDISKYTPTELLVKINEASAEHERLKNEIISDTLIFDELEAKINKNLQKLDDVEKNYVLLIEELNKR